MHGQQNIKTIGYVPHETRYCNVCMTLNNNSVLLLCPQKGRGGTCSAAQGHRLTLKPGHTLYLDVHNNKRGNVCAHVTMSHVRAYIFAVESDKYFTF